MHKNHIVSLSGGKDSTAMLLMMLEKDMKIDKIVFIDTTKEYENIYKHLNHVQEYLNKNYPSCPKIETITIDFDHYFKDHIKTKGENKGERGYGWPGFGNRWCTNLKIKKFKEATKHIDNIVEYHGIAADEMERVNKNPGRDIRYPLVDFNITEKQALQYCLDKGFTWKINRDDESGLYSSMDRASCFMCPLQKIEYLKLKYRDHYDTLWKDMKDMDLCTPFDFRRDYTLDQLENKFRCEIDGGKWHPETNECTYLNIEDDNKLCNQRNKKIMANNSSGVTGVYRYKKTGKWGAVISVNHNRLHLGSFEDIEDAIMARWNAEVKYEFPNCFSSSSSYQYLINRELI